MAQIVSTLKGPMDAHLPSSQMFLAIGTCANDAVVGRLHHNEHYYGDGALELFPRPGSEDAAPLDQLAFLDAVGIDAARRQWAAMEAGALGVMAQRVVFAEGWLTPSDYTRALAAQLNVEATADPQAVADDVVLIDATGQQASDVASAARTAHRLGRRAMLFPAMRDRPASARAARSEAIAADAVEALRATRPEFSAGRRMWFWQYVASALALGGAIGVVGVAPRLAGELILAGSAVAFAGVAVFRLILLLAALPDARGACVTALPMLSDRDLPDYGLLVPLFREAAILPDLVDALAAIDYPAAKLDIILILEEADRETRDAAARYALPPHMRVLVVPDRQPRTKPKALNFALAQTRAELIAVFDAEDVPAPGQLRLAAASFAARPGQFHCLQARLGIYNPRQSWLTRHFAIEYATLFHAFLPALVRLGWPLPLSGTSNHFPRAVLEEQMWDPFNVTEDADLGIRLTRLRFKGSGGRIGLIDTATREEAPSTFGQWLPQRTRWIKGWMQTYLVHTRRPWRLLRDLGVWRAIGFHALFGGFLLSVLAYPWLFILLGLELMAPVPFDTSGAAWHRLALLVAVGDLAAGVAAAMVMAYLGARRARLRGLKRHIATAPVYWLLVSLAGYRALGQFIWRPHYWEKTPHTARRRRLSRVGSESG